jgi:phosphoketolase
MAESMLGEPSHVSRVVFPADFNSAAATVEALYQTRGQIWTLVVPKVETPSLFNASEARRLVADGAVAIEWAGHETGRAGLILAAVGAYQLREVLAASRRLAERALPHGVVYILEPGRFRIPRGKEEEAHLAPASVRETLFPDAAARRILVTHTRPEPMMGLLAPFRSTSATAGLGYINQGGTYDTPGLLFVNRSSWAHCVSEAARLVGHEPEDFLTELELRALAGQISPHGIVIPEIAVPERLS